MSKNEKPVKVLTPKKFPLERALEKFALEATLLVKSVRKYIGRKPKDKTEMILKTIELIVWILLSYDLVRSVLPR